MSAASLPCDVVLVLSGPNGAKRSYPVPAGRALRDRYTIDGATWTVVAVWRDDELSATPESPVRQSQEQTA